MLFLPLTVTIASIITNAANLTKAVLENRTGVGFDIEGVVTLPNAKGTWHMAVEDDSGGVMIRNHSPRCDTEFFKPGERLRLRGKTNTNQYNTVFAECTQVVAIAVHPPPVPKPATADDILSGKYDSKLIQTTGIVREVFKDEIDPRWLYMILNCDGSRIPVVFISETDDISRFTALIDAEISVSGFCSPKIYGIRQLLGWHISCVGPDAIKVLVPAATDPFAAPEIDSRKLISPTEVAQIGRRRMNGRVVAVWSDRHFLLEDSLRELHRIELAAGKPPAYGDRVEVTGIPNTDLYRIHLGNALWRKTAGKPSNLNQENDSAALTLSDFNNTKFGLLNRFMKYNGRTIQFRGTVERIELGAVKYRSCTIRCEGFTINANSGTAGDFPEDIAIGTQVEVTGTCVISAGIWHPSVSFPHIEDTPMVVLRHKDDMRIIADPPWWTPLRLMIVIGLLLILMAAILLWAIALKFVAERRGRQLLKTEIGKAEESLRVEERTRLAVELHDSIAQNLTGAAFQIEAAKDATGEDSESATYLSCAEQILKSCRTELRRCIWDLRSNALEEPDINKAILSTIHPVTDGADVHVHFNVPRSRMSDTTAHAILRIIRELTANAVRHGRANRINIAGDFIDGQLHFTVSDNGCGFNPESCPDASTGHFGLDGIRERIDKFNGAISIDSSAGEGTRVEIRIQAPHSKPEKGN